MAGPPKGQALDLTKLTLHQLTLFKQQLEQELSFFQDSLGTLKHAQMKYQESGDCVESFTPESEGKEMIVPLGGAIYVPGVISKADTVTVSIGTGYYVEMNIEDAKAYFKRKVKYVTEQMEKVQIIGIEKSRIRDAVAEIMEMKIQAHLAAKMHGVSPKA